MPRDEEAFYVKCSRATIGYRTVFCNSWRVPRWQHQQTLFDRKSSNSISGDCKIRLLESRSKCRLTTSSDNWSLQLFRSTMRLSFFLSSETCLCFCYFPMHSVIRSMYLKLTTKVLMPGHDEQISNHTMQGRKWPQPGSVRNDRDTQAQWA